MDRKALLAWLRAFRDLGVEELEAPIPRVYRPSPRSSKPASDLREAREPRPARASSASRPGRPPRRGGEPAARLGSGERPPLEGHFPAKLQLLDHDDLEPLEEPPAGAEGLELVAGVLGECTRCRLHEGRTKIVFGVGNPRAEILFVGEGPGRDEDLQGEPFVGKAGRKLDEMIASIGHRREEVYICNVVKCRPPNNRTPSDDEAQTCSPFLHAQIAAVRPRVIVTVGRPAAEALLGRVTSMRGVRGRFHDYRGVPVMPTYHPAYLLRRPGENIKVAHDLALVLRLLGRELPSWAARALREGAP